LQQHVGKIHNDMAAGRLNEGSGGALDQAIPGEVPLEVVALEETFPRRRGFPRRQRIELYGDARGAALAGNTVRASTTQRRGRRSATMERVRDDVLALIRAELSRSTHAADNVRDPQRDWGALHDTRSGA
jgi:hypothetical protein